jgi:hypothetical protein
MIEDDSEDLSKREIDRNMLSTFEKYFPKRFIQNQPFKITYTNGAEHVRIFNCTEKTKAGNIRIEYSELYNQIRLDYKRNVKTFNDNINSRNEEDLMFSSASQQARHKILPKYRDFFDYAIFIPAGRSFFSNIENMIFTLLSRNQEIDPFLQEFGSFYENAKKRYLFRNKIHPIIEPLKDAIIRGDFFQEKGKDFIQFKDGRVVGMSNASSGQQEASPLFFALASLLQNRPLYKRTFFIEEPEAHIFPDAQNLLIEAIASIFNRNRNKINFVITTHSPYILSTFNNLTYASTVLNESNRAEIAKVININAIIESKLLSAYSTSGKSIKKIVCGETGLIDAEAIDSISNKISKQFDQLLDFYEHC